MDDRTKYLLIIPVLLLLIFSYFYYKSKSLLPSADNLIKTTTNNNNLRSFVEINGKTIFVRLAITDIEKDRGLSYQESLPEDHGMLFVFSDNSRPMFWMKGMNFPLDMIWISQNKIIAIDKKIPPPEAGIPDSEIPIYSPPQGIDYVLEVNGGISDKLGIKVNDPVRLNIE